MGACATKESENVVKRDRRDSGDDDGPPALIPKAGMSSDHDVRNSLDPLRQEEAMKALQAAMAKVPNHALVDSNGHSLERAPTSKMEANRFLDPEARKARDWNAEMASKLHSEDDKQHAKQEKMESVSEATRMLKEKLRLTRSTENSDGALPGALSSASNSRTDSPVQYGRSLTPPGESITLRNGKALPPLTYDDSGHVDSSYTEERSPDESETGSHDGSPSPSSRARARSKRKIVAILKAEDKWRAARKDELIKKREAHEATQQAKAEEMRVKEMERKTKELAKAALRAEVLYKKKIEEAAAAAREQARAEQKRQLEEALKAAEEARLKAEAEEATLKKKALEDLDASRRIEQEMMSLRG
eukprot:g20651.t1